MGMSHDRPIYIGVVEGSDYLGAKQIGKKNPAKKEDEEERKVISSVPHIVTSHS